MYRIENARCVKDTGQKILVEAPDLEEPTWIPKSQIEDESEVYKHGTDGVLIVNDWFAEKRGWA